jgi:regulator of sigma E protease
MSWLGILLAILGLALLMVIHESGHHLVARAFGMRVLRFSIGFGPPLWRHQPEGSPTVYQVALIPFLAYVQIAGMNPFEEADPDDRGSYANASLTARISTVVAGPLANYLFASVLFFAAFMLGGEPVPSTTIDVGKGGAAEQAQMKSGDKVVRIGGVAIETFDQMRKTILAHPKKPLEFVVLREGREVALTITPEPKAENGGGQIGVVPREERVPVSLRDAAVKSVIAPAMVVERLVVTLARIMTRQEKPDLSGPVGIVKITGSYAARGVGSYFEILGVLSAYLGGFNLLPVPALDGGRLMFLGYEAVTRRRANARVEAGVHALGLIMLLTLIAIVTVFDVRGH